VIVVEQSSKGISIYDGDTPDLTLWANFTSLMWDGAAVRGSVTAKNGIIVVAMKSQPNYSGQGLGILNFVADTYILESWNITYSGQSGGYQSGLTSSKIYKDFGSGVRTYNLVNLSINDVAMTVLPNAPIDSATGLPIPTIAVATDGGVSVIKDDGTVVDIKETSGPNSVRDVTFRKSDGKLGFRWSDTAGNDNYLHVGYCPIPSSDKSIAYFYQFSTATFAGFEDHSYSQSGSDTSDAYPSIMPTGSHIGDGTALVDNNIGTNLGLVRTKENPASIRNGMAAYITSKYNTGYMTGDIRGAWNVDTDVTSLSGTELVTNGTFASNITGWSEVGDGSQTWSSGTMAVAGSSTGYGRSQQDITVVSGKQYVITVEKTNSSSSSSWVHVGDAATWYVIASWTHGVGDSTRTLTFTATGTTLRIQLGAYPNVTAFFDNISVREAIPDRSVKGNGLVVHGTPTVSAVATGAELKCISGFSTSNYLEQPYNSDLDFGTGDFSFMGWIKPTGGYDDGYIIHRGDAGNGSGLMAIRRGYGGGEFPRIHWGSTGFDYDLIFNKKVTDGVWSFIVVMRSGSTLQTFVNAVSSGETTSSTNISNPNGKLRMGLRMDTVGQAIQGSLALWRISATAPSAEQIKEIYEAEKVLFQENAKCTLNGSSDAVTALAYDDSTELLHVGTSGGRSAFQGLRRVDETSTSTTEIAAQGGLIVEET
jgi:hypothetical protein